MPAPGFITGLASEADCLLPYFPASTIAISGMNPDAAERGARALCAGGCRVLVSFGLAGALVAAVSPGTLIVAREIVTAAGERHVADAALSAAVRAAAPAARSLPIAGSDEVVATWRDKIVLNQLSGASAVDMESHRVARVAGELGVAFIAIRAVADTCDAAIPRAATQAIDAAGRPRVGHVLTRVLQRPWEIFGVARLAAQSRAAHRSLRDVAPLLLDRLVAG